MQTAPRRFVRCGAFAYPRKRVAIFLLAPSMKVDRITIPQPAAMTQKPEVSTP